MSQSKGTMSTINGGVESSVVESPASSCVSEEVEEVVASRTMVVAGCPQCLMYVMLWEEEKQLKCPRCKSPVLLHFQKCDSANKS